MDNINGSTPREVDMRFRKASKAKANLSWVELILKSFMGGLFISLGASINLYIAGGSSGLRASNPAIATMLSGFTFPTGFVLTIITNTELATSNMFLMAYAALQRNITVYDLARNWIVSYIFNMAGCLFFAGFFCWWTDTLESEASTAYAIQQAENRVMLASYWSRNFLRAVGCNWLVGMALFLATASNEVVSKIYGIWVAVWAFVILGYQHSIANFYLVPIGMFYGTSFGVGKFIYRSVIPVTLGNILGGVLDGVIFWYFYGRNTEVDAATGDPMIAEKKNDDVGRPHRNSTSASNSSTVTSTDGYAAHMA